MNKKGQIISPKTLVFIFGGAILGFLLLNKIEAAIIGGIIGGILSFLK